MPVDYIFHGTPDSKKASGGTVALALDTLGGKLYYRDDTAVDGEVGWNPLTIGSQITVDGSSIAAPNFSSTTPAAPGGDTNVIFQTDSHGNVSAYVPTGISSVAWSSLTGTLSNGQVIPYADAGISRLAGSSLAIGNGTNGDYSGSLSLTNLWVAGVVHTGNNSAFPSNPPGVEPDAWFYVSNKETRVAPPGQYIGETHMYNLAPTAPAASSNYLAYLVESLNTGSQPIGELVSQFLEVGNTGTGNVGTMFGQFMLAYNASSGTITELYGQKLEVLNLSGTGGVTKQVGIDLVTGSATASSAVTTDYTLLIETPLAIGLISTHYGLYIDDQTNGGTNNPNPWAIYSNGGNSYLKGSLLTSGVLGLGTTSTPDSGISRLAANSLAIGNGTNGDFSGTLKTTTVNAVTGFQVNGTAPSGHILLGNGTNYVDGTVAGLGVAWSSLTSTLSNGQVIPYADAGISRLAASSLAIGNGTAGDFTGNLKLTTIRLVGGTGTGTPVAAPLNILVDANGEGFVVQYTASDYTDFISGGSVKGLRGFGAIPMVIGTSNSSSSLSIYSGTGVVYIGNASQVGNNEAALQAKIYGFAADSTSAIASDSGISRLGAASVAIGNGTASDTTGNLSLNTIIKYAGVATVGAGVPSLIAKIDLTAQSAAIAAGTALYAVPATGAGFYRVTSYAKITTASDISSTLGGAGGFVLTWTDPTDSTTPTAVTFSDQSSQSLTGNTTTTVYVTSAVVACKASTNLQYGFGYTDSHTSTAMAYKLSVKVEYLG